MEKGTKRIDGDGKRKRESQGKVGEERGQEVLKEEERKSPTNVGAP